MSHLQDREALAKPLARGELRVVQPLVLELLAGVGQDHPGSLGAGRRAEVVQGHGGRRHADVGGDGGDGGLGGWHGRGGVEDGGSGVARVRGGKKTRGEGRTEKESGELF